MLLNLFLKQLYFTKDTLRNIKQNRTILDQIEPKKVTLGLHIAYISYATSYMKFYRAYFTYYVLILCIISHTICDYII